MTTNYVVSGRGDLDDLFKARTAGFTTATGYTIAGVDLNQRFEPRGSTTPIANTGFTVAGVDLADYFANISGVSQTGNMTAGNSGSFFGFQGANGIDTTYGSCTIGLFGVNTLLRLNWQGAAGQCSVTFGHGSVTPADSDATWQRIETSGTYSNGSGTRTLLRSAHLGTSTASGAGMLQRTWQLGGSGGPPPSFVNGNTYTVVIYRN